jgi:hypothetical protein
MGGKLIKAVWIGISGILVIGLYFSIPGAESEIPAKPAWKSFKTGTRVMSLAKEGPYLWIGNPRRTDTL